MEKRCYGCMKLKQNSPVCEHCGYDETANKYPHHLPAGTVLQNQYTVGRVLGQGGFGITYVGWDKNLDTQVAIKEYYPNMFVNRDCRSSLMLSCSGNQSQELFLHNRDRFLREARYLAKLQDVPGIVEIRSLFQENNTAYMVMEYVHGVDLKRYIKNLNRPLQAQEAFALLKPVMYSMSKVHEAGLVHRDISPDNIMVSNDGGVKLLDFGAAREVENPHVGKELPQSTETILKHGFAPMEQYQRRGALGPWTDVYALCATLYFCMTGKVPGGAMERYMGEEEPEWEQLPGLTRQQVSALKQGMAIKPENRIRTMGQLWKALFEEPDKQAETADPTWGTEKEIPPKEKEVAKSRKSAKNALIAVAAAAVLAGVAGFALLGQKKPMPETQLQSQITVDSGETTATETQVPETSAPEMTESETMPLETENTEPSAPPAPDPAWKKNVLRPDVLVAINYDYHWMKGYTEYENRDFVYLSAIPVYGSNIERSWVTDVFFLDSVEGAPANAWDVSAARDRSVLAWTKKNGKSAQDLYIAGEGGINGAQACRRLFYGYTELNTVNFNGCFHTEDAVDLSYMFAHCRRLTSVDFSSLDTSGVVNMEGLFSGCEKLQVLDLSGVDTSSVADMGHMFGGCTNLKTMDVTGLVTAQVTDMEGMFSGCRKLPVLDMRNFNTSSVENMSGMFCGMEAMASFDLSMLDTTRVKKMSGMFKGCSNPKLTTLDLRGFDTAEVTDMSYMFADCAYFESLDLSNFDTSNVIDMRSMFYYCRRITSIDVSSFDTAAVQNMSGMFEMCSMLPELDVSHFDTGNVIDMSRMFISCGRLTQMDPTGFDVSSVKRMDNMFDGCGIPYDKKVLGGNHVW